MPQLEEIEAIEKRLWKAADTLRANSNYASNEYFLPVMGLIFLRHAYSRFLAVQGSVGAGLPTRGGKTRPLAKEDFSQKGAIFLQPKAQFDHLVSLPEGEDRAKSIIEAMESIEADYENLRGVLPKSEYQELDNKVLGQLLRTLNPDELKKVSGDVFGRIYEYFLTQFADQKAHDAGEFFTPISLVSLIAHVLDPERGTVLDPACGSGGMFVQSARIVEEHGQRPTDRLHLPVSREECHYHPPSQARGGAFIRSGQGNRFCAGLPRPAECAAGWGWSISLTLLILIRTSSWVAFIRPSLSCSTRAFSFSTALYPSTALLFNDWQYTGCSAVNASNGNASTAIK